MRNKNQKPITIRKSTYRAAYDDYNKEHGLYICAHGLPERVCRECKKNVASIDTSSRE